VKGKFITQKTQHNLDPKRKYLKKDYKQSPQYFPRTVGVKSHKKSCGQGQSPANFLKPCRFCEGTWDTNAAGKSYSPKRHE
jgi:hypothetical protein